MLWKWRGEDRPYLPGHGEGRDDLVADRDGLDLAAGLDHGADELVAHDEARRGGLVAAVNVQFPEVAVRLCWLADNRPVQGADLRAA